MNQTAQQNIPARQSILRNVRKVPACLMAGFIVMVGTGALVKAGIATELLQGVADNAKMKQARNDMMAITNCLEIYRLNAGVYPTTEQGIKALVEKPAVAPIPKLWMRIMEKTPVDPWGHPYQYRFPGKKDPAKYELFSLGKDGVAGTADDIRKDE